MAVELEINDGPAAEWWLSPDIWTVPGDDPEGPAALPRPGEPFYVWARVRNRTRAAVQDARVRFYWADPSAGFTRASLEQLGQVVGTAAVSFTEGQASQEVLCLTPVSLPAGHSCLLAEAYHPWLDPLPTMAKFNVPTDRHVAQRNISVVMTRDGTFRMTFDVHNSERLPRSFTLAAEPGSVDSLKTGWDKLFILPAELRDGAVRDLGLSLMACPDAADRPAPKMEGVKLAAGTRRRLSVTGRLDGQMGVAHIRTYCDGAVIGGLSVLILQKEVL